MAIQAHRVILLLAAPALAALALARSPQRGCAPDNGGLRLPRGFCASLIADDLPKVRHLAVSPGGDLYAAAGGGLVRGGIAAFRDRDGKGTFEERASFGPRGANDVALHDGWIYAAYDDRVLRWRLERGRLTPEGEPETVVQGLPIGGDHDAKTILFPGGDTLLVKIGSATNSCQRANRAARSRGIDPCPELTSRAGIWRFDAGKPRQTMADGQRWATGLRNAEALAIQPGTNRVWAAVNGRDQLGANWGFSDSANAADPAEELMQVSAGDDLGWPYCYFSNEVGKKVLAPEYGGDGRQAGRCGSAKDPALAFPGHWAPLSLAFYPGTGFGSAYAGGLFVAFHGSWNRAPLPQAGFRVVFVPFKDARPLGTYDTFATMAGTFRPVGLAVGKDGALFVSADEDQKIWRIVPR